MYICQRKNICLSNCLLNKQLGNVISLRILPTWHLLHSSPSLNGRICVPSFSSFHWASEGYRWTFTGRTVRGCPDTFETLTVNMASIDLTIALMWCQPDIFHWFLFVCTSTRHFGPAPGGGGPGGSHGDGSDLHGSEERWPSSGPVLLRHHQVRTTSHPWPLILTSVWPHTHIWSLKLKEYKETNKGKKYFCLYFLRVPSFFHLRRKWSWKCCSMLKAWKSSFLLLVYFYFLFYNKIQFHLAILPSNSILLTTIHKIDHPGGHNGITRVSESRT